MTGPSLSAARAPRVDGQRAPLPVGYVALPREHRCRRCLSHGAVVAEAERVLRNKLQGAERAKYGPSPRSLAAVEAAKAARDKARRERDEHYATCFA